MERKKKERNKERKGKEEEGRRGEGLGKGRKDGEKRERVLKITALTNLTSAPA